MDKRTVGLQWVTFQLSIEKIQVMAKKIKTADYEKSKPEKGFSVHGLIQESETGAGIPGLIVEVVDQDKCRDDRLGSCITDKKGRFNLCYEAEDFRQLYYEKRPDLYLRVKTADDKIIHTTKGKVRYEAGRTEAFIIQLSVIEDLPPDFMEVTFAPARAKKDTPVKVDVRTTPGGNAYFSIFQLPGARRIEMTEDPNKPGFYHGEYIAHGGDKIDHAPMTAVYTSKEGKVYSRQASGKISIDTHTPAISGVTLDPTGRFLFQLDAKLEDQLKAGTISDKVLNAFVQKGIPLQQDARIETQNGFWWITDRASRYLINRVGDKWRVYKDGFIVRNGESFQLLLRSKPKAQIKVLLPELDTEKEKAVLLNENPKSPGEYSAKIKISGSNKAGNGIKRMQISVTDAFGNKGDDLVTSVELVNPEYASFKNIPSEHATLLEKQGIVTFAHIRAMDVQQTAQATGLEADILRKYQALASIQTIAPNPDVAEALVEQGGYTSAAFMGFVDVDEIMKALEKSAGGGPKQNVAYTNQVAENLSAAGRQLVGMLDEQRIRDQIKPANACGEVCAPETSVFSCFAYLAYLLDKAGFATDKSLRQIFGWNVAAVTTEPVSRIAICLGILRPRVNINHSLPAQMEYDRLLNERLIALTGKTQEQLKSDPVYQHIFTAQDIHQQNLWLEQDLLQVNGPGFADTVKAVHSALESKELDALIAQSGKTAEAWREQFYIAFDTRECDKASYCQQAILVMQEYLHRNPPKKTQQKLLLSYDEWLSNQMKKYYPENYYGIEFKRSLIRGEREGLKRQLKKSVEILDKIFVTDRGKIPSLDDSSSLMTSFSFKDNIYNNFVEGISMIENCVKVDDLILEGHHAFFNEEYQLSRLYYFEAARKIREISKKIRKTYTLIPFMKEEPETADEPLGDPNRKTSMKKIINSDYSSSFLGVEPYQIEQKITEYWRNLYISYLNDNMPGGKLIKGMIPLNGVDAEGKFVPIGDYDRDENIEKLNSVNKWETHFFYHYLDKSWVYYFRVNNNGQLQFWVDHAVGLITPPRMHYLAFVYQKGSYFLDYQINLECKGARHLQGVAIRWQDKNNFVTITLGTMGGADWGLMIGKIIAEDPDERTLKIVHKYDTYSFEYRRDKTYKLEVKVIGQEVIASAFVKNGTNGWDPSGEVHASIHINEMPLKGTFALLSSGSPDESIGEILCGATFNKITAIDLTAGKGAFSDLAFFLKPVFPVEARGISDYGKRKDKFNPVTADSNDQLLSHVSINYQENLYVINENKSGFLFDPLYSDSGDSKPRELVLWYPQNSDRLNRENLRKVLDQLPFLFIHQYFFILPVCLGDVANAIGNYEEASNWYRLVLNEWRELNIQIPVYPYMQPQIESPMLLQRIAKNYLDWANHLFRENTKESVHNARLHFKRVLDLLDSHNCCGLRSHEPFKNLLVYLTENKLPPQKVVPVLEAVLDFSGTFGLEQATTNLVAGLNMQFETAKTPAEGLAAAAQYLNTEIQKLKQPRKTEVLPLPRQTLVAKLEKLEKAYPDVLNQLDQNKRDISGLVQILQNSKPANASTGSTQGQPDGTSQLSGLTGYNPLPNPGTATVSILSTETFFSESIFNPMSNVGIQGFLGRTGGPISLQPHYPEYRINHDFCLPPNPYNRSLTEQACRVGCSK